MKYSQALSVATAFISALSLYYYKATVEKPLASSQFKSAMEF